MPASFVVTSGPERVVHVYTDGDRTSSGGSASQRSPISSGGSRSISSEGSWSEVEYDDIDPSDSASRSRQPASRRHTVEARPAPTRRHSSRRVEPREEIPTRRQSSRQHHSSRHEPRHESRHDSRHGRSSSRRVPSDESSSTVASADDYPPYGHHGVPRAQYLPQSGYRHVPAPSHGGHPGYPPSMASGSAYPDAYGQPHQALVPMRHDHFGYPQPNPFSPQSQHPSNPFSPMTSAESSNYFVTDPMAPPQHHRPHRPEGPPRPQSFAAPSSHYPGSELMAPYQQPPMTPYGGFGMPGYPYPPMHAGWPPSTSPPPREPPRDEKRDAEMAALKAMLEKRQDEDDNKKKEKASEIDALKELIKKHEEERVAREAAWIKEREAEAAAKAAEKAKAEEEEKRKAEIDDARKKAKEDAEKKAEEAANKAKEEHEKKLAEAEKAKAEVDKAKKDLEDEIAKNKPTPDSLKAPIKFKDAVGRKFSFPWHLCKTWKGMESLIKQAFLHVDLIGDHVYQGHYDLTGPDGEIILPQVWDTMVQPDWEITMHLWPMEEEKKDEPPIDPFANLGLGGMPGHGDFGMMSQPGMDGGKKKSGKKDGSKKKKGGSPDVITVMPPPPPQHPGMGHPPGPFGDPFAALGIGGGFPHGISAVPDRPPKDKTKARSKSKSSKEISPLAAWFAGGSVSNSKPKKDDEKLGPSLSRAKSHPSAPNGGATAHHDQANCVVM